MTSEPTPAHDKQPPAKAGAPSKNRNAMRHGLRSSRSPKGCQDLDRQACAFRIAIEDAFTDAQGRQPNAREAALILAATQWMLHSRKAGRWAAQAHSDLTVGERVSLSAEQARASENAAKCLSTLGLPAGQAVDTWAAVYAEDHAA